VDDLWATKSENVWLVVPAISFQDFQPIHQHLRRTDRQTKCDRKTALCTTVHRMVEIENISLPVINAV